MRRLRSESGQVIPFVGILLLTTMIGMCAFAIDFGAWFTASRHAQNVADAAALAAVQDLPGNPTAARTDAAAYALSNEGALDGTPVVTTTDVADDTITVKTVETSPAYFARIFGVNSVTVHASASAQAAGIKDVNGGGFGNGVGEPVPLAVSQSDWLTHRLNQEFTLTYGPQGAIAGGQFGLVDFSKTGATIKASTIAGWVTGGYPGTLSTGVYPGIVGNRFSPPSLRTALPTIKGKVITLPIFSGTNGVNGANMTYTVAGWAAFKVTDVGPVGGADTKVTGMFVHLDVAPGPEHSQYFGVGHVKLTK